MKPELFEAYKNTTYRVHSPLGEVDIKIGAMNPLLQQLLLHYNTTDWAFITAWNPYSLQQKMEVNIPSNNQLEGYLLANHYVFFKGLGLGDDGSWEPEASFMVLNILKEDAIKLGVKFKQNAIVVGVIGKMPELINLGLTQLNKNMFT